MATMPGVMLMRDIQRKIAQKSGIAYWDMFAAMGGENSIKKYTEAQPPLAAKDYTHLTFRGGRKLAKKLADALLNEKRKYDKKR
jgi:lysophospholipase L1-like esterase